MQVLGAHASEQAKRSLAATLGSLALTSLGPCGASNVIQASESVPAGVITTCSSRLFTGMCVMLITDTCSTCKTIAGSTKLQRAGCM